MNLLTDKWIQVRDFQGKSSKIAPCDIVDKNVYLDFPRSDLNLSVSLFLIGIVQLYRARYVSKPKSAQDFYKVVSEHLKAFEMEGPTPFMQDPNLEKNPRPILGLIIDSPGEKTLKDHRDFWRKEGSILDLCPSCAAAALYTQQMFAYPGGLNFMQSPLCNSIIAFKFHENLWDLVWENSLPHADFSTYGNGMSTAKGADVFPWLSICGKLRILSDIPAEQLYWLMPWRVRLTIENKKGTCGCCGEETDRIVSNYYKAPNGISYRGVIHPLSLHYTIINKKGSRVQEASASIIALKHKKLSEVLYCKVASPTMVSPGDLVVSGILMANCRYECWIDKHLYFDPNKADLVKKMLTVEEKARGLLLRYSNPPKTDRKNKDFSSVNQLEDSLEMTFYDTLKSNKGISEWASEVVKQTVNAFDKVSPRQHKWKTWFCSELKATIEKAAGCSVDVSRNFVRREVCRLPGKAEIQILKWWSWITKYDKKVRYDLADAKSWEEMQGKEGFITLFNKITDILFPSGSEAPEEDFFNRLSLAAYLVARLKNNGDTLFPRISGDPFNRVSDLEKLVHKQSVNIISIFNSILYS